MLFRSKKEVSAEIAQREHVVLYKKVFGSPEGRKVLIDLMDRFHIVRSHQGDARLEGQREVALYIMNTCAINLTELDNLLKGDDHEHNIDYIG